MYELKNGRLPSEDPDYDPQKPYENRDDRFYASVLYSGVPLWGREVELYTGGKDYPAAIGQRGCETGYAFTSTSIPWPASCRPNTPCTTTRYCVTPRCC